MADAVDTQILVDNEHRTVIKLGNHSDGTGEFNVRKVDASTLVNSDNTGAERLTVSKVWWSIHSKDDSGHVDISWDGNPNQEFLHLTNGVGEWNLNEHGFSIPNNATSANGDILFTTNDWKIGDGYTIIMELKKSAGFPR